MLILLMTTKATISKPTVSISFNKKKLQVTIVYPQLFNLAYIAKSLSKYAKQF